MSNNYFRFKQFTVQQDRCAMKVSTDACIQGAWTPVLPATRHVLDIGAGTGLLSLMLAQRNADILVDAVEFDEAAAKQAQENVEVSPWSARIRIWAADVRTFTGGHQYDLIICNPPFFQNSLLGDEAARNIARHTLTLSYADLIAAFERLLAPLAYASVMLPVAEHQVWEQLLLQKGWQVFRRLVIKHRDAAAPTRVVSLCTKAMATDEGEETLIIKDTNEQYTDAFISLLRPYYLKL